MHGRNARKRMFNRILLKKVRHQEKEVIYKYGRQVREDIRKEVKSYGFLGRLKFVFGGGRQYRMNEI